jgi:hypothetical protein
MPRYGVNRNPSRMTDSRHGLMKHLGLILQIGASEKKAILFHDLQNTAWYRVVGGLRLPCQF